VKQNTRCTRSPRAARASGIQLAPLGIGEVFLPERNVMTEWKRRYRHDG
jgi:hypothetical protein